MDFPVEQPFDITYVPARECTATGIRAKPGSAGELPNESSDQ